MSDRRCRCIAVVCGLLAVACGNTPAAPTPTPTGTTALTFSAITTDSQTVAVYSEGGYSLSASGGWVGKTGFGNPLPFIEFVTPAASTVTASVTVFANDHAPFAFRSVDLYSSITPIPYVMSGVRNFSVVFTVTDVVPNTFGTFKTVASNHAADPIDTLTIQLTNPSTCCPNPIGIDNIVLSRQH